MCNCSFNSPKILFPSFQLIIALEETIDMISIYAPSQTQDREMWDKALRGVNAQWLLRLQTKAYVI